MKWPQYGGQRKLVMILIMILLCFTAIPVLSICLQTKIVTYWYLFHVLNSVRLTSPHQNTQKSLAAPSANTEVYKIHCHWWSMIQYEKPLLIQMWTINCCSGIVCPILNDNWLVYIFKYWCVTVKFFYNVFHWQNCIRSLSEQCAIREFEIEMSLSIV